MPGLTRADINFIIRGYIGIGSFPEGVRHFTHAELSRFLEFDIEIQPEKIPPYGPGAGNSKEDRLWAVLASSDPRVQLAIVEGIAKRVPSPTQEAADRMNAIWKRLRDEPGILLPEAKSARQEVRAALEGAALLIREQGPAHAVDRLHTALQGYMIQKAKEGGAHLAGGEPIDSLIMLLWKHHPRFEGDRNAHPAVVKILRAQAKTLDALDDVRDDESQAHPNDLIGEEEAHLVFSAGVLLFSYLERKLE